MKDLFLNFKILESNELNTEIISQIPEDLIDYVKKSKKSIYGVLAHYRVVLKENPNQVQIIKIAKVIKVIEDMIFQTIGLDSDLIRRTTMRYRKAGTGKFDRFGIRGSSEGIKVHIGILTNE